MNVQQNEAVTFQTRSRLTQWQKQNSKSVLKMKKIDKFLAFVFLSLCCFIFLYSFVVADSSIYSLLYPPNTNNNWQHFRQANKPNSQIKVIDKQQQYWCHTNANWCQCTYWIWRDMAKNHFRTLQCARAESLSFLFRLLRRCLAPMWINIENLSS